MWCKSKRHRSSSRYKTKSTRFIKIVKDAELNLRHWCQYFVLLQYRTINHTRCPNFLVLCSTRFNICVIISPQNTAVKPLRCKRLLEMKTIEKLRNYCWREMTKDQETRRQKMHSKFCRFSWTVKQEAESFSVRSAREVTVRIELRSYI